MSKDVGGKRSASPYRTSMYQAQEQRPNYSDGTFSSSELQTRLMYAHSSPASCAAIGYSLLSLAVEHFHALNLLGADQNTRRDELWVTVITASGDKFLGGQSVFCIMHWENVETGTVASVIVDNNIQ